MVKKEEIVNKRERESERERDCGLKECPFERMIPPTKQ